MAPGTRAGIWFFSGAKRPSRALICVCRGLSASPGAPGAFDLPLLEQTGIWGFGAVLRDPRRALAWLSLAVAPRETRGWALISLAGVGTRVAEVSALPSPQSMTKLAPVAVGTQTGSTGEQGQHVAQGQVPPGQGWPWVLLPPSIPPCLPAPWHGGACGSGRAAVPRCHPGNLGAGRTS